MRAAAPVSIKTSLRASSQSDVSLRSSKNDRAFALKSFLLALAYVLVALVMGSTAQASGVPKIRSCEYDASSVKNAGIPWYGQHGTAVEMIEKRPGLYRGVDRLSNGHWLEIKAMISGSSLLLSSRVFSGEIAVLSSKAVAQIKPQPKFQRFNAYLKDRVVQKILASEPNIQNPLDSAHFPVGETHYTRFHISCLLKR
jgi:hypothetical protein